MRKLRRALPDKIELSPEKRKALEEIWFVFGNNGAKHTHGNHRFIQTILEHGEDSRKFYSMPNRVPGFKPVTQECMDEVDKILGDRCAVVLSNGHVTAAVKGSGKPKQGES